MNGSVQCDPGQGAVDSSLPNRPSPEFTIDPLTNDAVNHGRTRRRDMYLSMISHELRAPLGQIKGYATTLLLPDVKWDDAVVRHCLQTIVAAADDLEILVDRLLDSSAMSDELFGVRREPLPLNVLIDSLITRRYRPVHRHTFETRLSDSLPVVFVDPQRIGQVLINLLENAIKFSPEGGPILVSAAATSGHVQVSVTDEGIGISPFEQNQVFRPFQQGSGALARNIPGSGLGLTICRRIIDSHGGDIWIQSPAPGRDHDPRPGTVVSFTLPAVT